MTRLELAHILAISLTQGAWRADVLSAVLRRRFPRVLHRFADTLAGQVVQILPAVYAPDPSTLAPVLADVPEFELVYRYCQRRDVWPGPDLTPPSMAPIAAFDSLPLPDLATERALADWLGMTPERLAYLADPQSRHETHGDTAVNHYHYRLKPKASGGMRLIEAPKTHLKAIQRRILHGILDHVPAHPDSFGFVRGRNCLQAAQRHVGEDVVLCFDLKDFFAGVRYPRVFGVFRCLGYPRAVTTCLASLCTVQTPERVLHRLAPEDRAFFRAPHLPQGAPSSPALAGLVAHGLDRRLSGLARRLGANYSRYADDLSFSGDAGIARVLAQTVPDIVRGEGFVLNGNKTRIRNRQERQVVTGIIVNEHLNMDRKQFDRLKAVIHACGKPGDTRLTDDAFCASLVGQIDWAERINPGKGRKLRALLHKVLQRQA